MSKDKSAPPSGPEAARLAIGWEIVRASEIHKNNPVHVATVLAQVIQILKRAETPPPQVTGDVTVNAVSPKDSSASPGGTLHLTYSFSGGPTSIPLVVFVHFYAEGGDGSPVWGDDHDPPKPTTAWSGAVSYTREIRVPEKVPPGKYRVGIGLYDDAVGGDRLELRTGVGVASTSGKRYEVGSVRVG